MLPSGAAKRCLVLLVILILIAAAINLPVTFALFVVPFNGPSPPTRVNVIGAEAAVHQWPVRTPHQQPWPAITQWSEEAWFGEVRLLAWSATPDRQTTHQMAVHRYGWPIASMERRMLWWPRRDPAWTIPVQFDQDVYLRWAGVVLNPFVAGGSLWLLLVVPWFAWGAARRSLRRRRGRCLACGYDLAGSGGAAAGCPECGQGRCRG